MHFRSFLDGGAYGSYGEASTFYTGALQTVTYDVPRYKFEGLRVFTNKPPCGPKRGHGTPQPRFAVEVQIDKIADELGLDPVEMRRRHLVKPNTITANYLRVGSIGLGECIDKVVEASDWKVQTTRIRQGDRICQQLIYLRRRTADLLEQHAAFGCAASAGSSGRSLRDVRFD
jgi:CO/xanthine dehydrogenase Mo-binding subunit